MSNRCRNCRESGVSDPDSLGRALWAGGRSVGRFGTALGDRDFSSREGVEERAHSGLNLAVAFLVAVLLDQEGGNNLVKCWWHCEFGTQSDTPNSTMSVRVGDDKGRIKGGRCSVQWMQIAKRAKY